MTTNWLALSIGNIINIINKHLLIIYKSTSLNILLFKNKYMILSLLLLALITFLFNKNLDYFTDLTIENLFDPTNIKSITFFLVTFYLCYIKFNILIRTIAQIKGISFFYKEIKLKLNKEIKFICLYFHILNLFFISISILFVINLTNNIFIINYDLGMLINYLTNITSILILLFYFNKIINNKFTIDQTEINPLKILLLIIIVFTPLILLNLYADKVNNLLGEYNIFKFQSIHCESKDKDDLNYINKLKEGTNVITNNTNNTIINFNNSSNNSNINSDTKPNSNLIDRNLNASTSTLNKNKLPFPTDSNSSAPIVIDNFKQLPKEVFNQMLKEFHYFKTVGHFETLSCNMLTPFNEIILSDNLIEFLNNHINSVISDDKKLDYDKTMKFLIKIYEKDIKMKKIIESYVDRYNQRIQELDNLKDVKYNELEEVQNNYIEFHKNYYLPHKTNLEKEFDLIFNMLTTGLNKEIEEEISLLKNPSMFDKALNKLNKFKSLIFIKLKNKNEKIKFY